MGVVDGSIHAQFREGGWGWWMDLIILCLGRVGGGGGWMNIYVLEGMQEGIIGIRGGSFEKESLWQVCQFDKLATKGLELR